MKTRSEYDFEGYIQSFIDQLTGEANDFKETIYRKTLTAAIDQAKRHIDHVLDDFLKEIECGFDKFKPEIAEKMAKEFSEYYWEKFSDGHSWEEGMKAVCYFKETNKYFVGIYKNNLHGEAGNFLLENGKLADPDYVGALYEFNRKE